MAEINNDWSMDTARIANPDEKKETAAKYPMLQWHTKVEYDGDEDADGNLPKYSGWSMPAGKFTDFDNAMVDANMRTQKLKFIGTKNEEDHWIFGNITALPLTRAFDQVDGRTLDMWNLRDGKDINRSDESNVIVCWRPARDRDLPRSPIRYKENGSPATESIYRLPVFILTAAGAGNTTVYEHYPHPVMLGFNGRIVDTFVTATDKWSDPAEGVLAKLVSGEFSKEVKAALTKQSAEYEKLTKVAPPRRVNLMMVAMPLGRAGEVELRSAVKAGKASTVAAPGLVYPKKQTAEWAASLVVPGAVRKHAEDLFDELHEHMWAETLRELQPKDLVMPEPKLNSNSGGRRPAYMAAPPAAAQQEETEDQQSW
jgi:hypothetical protein